MNSVAQLCISISKGRHSTGQATLSAFTMSRVTTTVGLHQAESLRQAKKLCLFFYVTYKGEANGVWELYLVTAVSEPTRTFNIKREVVLAHFCIYV